MQKAQAAPKDAPAKLINIPRNGPKSAPPAKVNTIVGRNKMVARQYNNKKKMGAMKPRVFIHLIITEILC